MPPSAQLTTLIDKVDGFELVRDQVGAILLVETAAQQALAVTASRDSTLWAFRVFVERTDPWGDFLDLPDDIDPAFAPLPVVNVWFDGSTYDKASSNQNERQHATSTLNVDIYTYGVSRDTADGHLPGDLAARLDLHRVIRLVRNMLMSTQYVYLGLRGFVWGRWLASVDIFEPPMDVRAAQRVGAARLVLQVDHNEFAPAVPTVPLEGITLKVYRDPQGELLFTSDFNP
jgi:hypothetical protein